MWQRFNFEVEDSKGRTIADCRNDWSTYDEMRAHAAMIVDDHNAAAERDRLRETNRDLLALLDEITAHLLHDQKAQAVGYTMTTQNAIDNLSGIHGNNFANNVQQARAAIAQHKGE